MKQNLGYCFIKLHLGKEFAAEAARKCIQYGFEKLQIQTIVGKAVREQQIFPARA